MNLGARLPQFSEAALTAFQKLGQWISQKAPKKRDEKARTALDNAVAALMQLAVHHPSAIPAGVEPWGVIVGKLPLKNDTEEGKKAHNLLADLVMQQNVAVLGPSHANVGKILSCFAEIHKSETISDKDLDAKIDSIFQKMSQGVLQGLATSFTEKQMLRIQKIVASAAAAPCA